MKKVYLISIFGLILAFFIINNFVLDEKICLACEKDKGGYTNKDIELINNKNMIKDFEISAEEVVGKIEGRENIVLLDVRTVEEYSVFHLENALLLPVAEISPTTLASIGLGEDKKDQEIIVYCRSGSRSKQAYDILQTLGYTNIKSLSGGMNYWQENNLPFLKNI